MAHQRLICGDPRFLDSCLSAIHAATRRAQNVDKGQSTQAWVTAGRPRSVIFGHTLGHELLRNATDNAHFGDCGAQQKACSYE